MEPEIIKPAVTKPLYIIARQGKFSFSGDGGTVCSWKFVSLWKSLGENTLSYDTRAFDVGNELWVACAGEKKATGRVEVARSSVFGNKRGVRRTGWKILSRTSFKDSTGCCFASRRGCRLLDWLFYVFLVILSNKNSNVRCQRAQSHFQVNLDLFKSKFISFKKVFESLFLMKFCFFS